MRIDLGGGAYMESDEGPRDTQFHQRILRSEPILNTRCGHFLYLACGHKAMCFGPIAAAAGRVLCMECRDARN